jgi:D-3-phosphoglycerate dehydrogenase
MAPNAKRVFYVKYLSGPVFGQILAKRPDIQLDKLENETPDAEAEPILSQAHAYQIGASRQVIGRHLQVTDALLAKTPNLVAVSSNGAGYDTIDVDACTRQGIVVVNQSGGNKEAVAEHALAMLLTLSKRIIEVDRRMRRAPDIPRNEYIGTELLDKTIGIIGIGNVGGRLAELCKGLFRMRVLAYDPYLTDAQIAAKGAEKVENLDDMLRQADYVSVKQIAGAGLDVWEDEPPPHDHKLMAFDNVLVSPHTAGATVESRDNMARFAAEQLIDILDGKRPPRLINPEVWPAYCERFERLLGLRPES